MQTLGMLLSESMFAHYVEPEVDFMELHKIFNQVRPGFPYEMTELISHELELCWGEMHHEAMEASGLKERMHSDLYLFRRVVCGISTVNRRMYSSKLVQAVDKATWLATCAYTELPYSFGIRSQMDTAAILMEFPRLRRKVADIGIRAVENLPPRSSSYLAYETFVDECRGYMAVVTSSLYRNYLDDLLDDWENGVMDTSFDSFDSAVSID